MEFARAIIASLGLLLALALAAAISTVPCEQASHGSRIGEAMLMAGCW